MNNDHFQILLVDDEKQINELAMDAFEMEGFKVVTACDGAEALQLWQQNPSSYHAIITDLMMPKLDGLELIKTIFKSENTPSSTLYYLVSGTNENPDCDEALKSKMKIVQKPYDIFEFVQRVGEDLRCQLPQKTAS